MVVFVQGQLICHIFPIQTFVNVFYKNYILSLFITSITNKYVIILLNFFKLNTVDKLSLST